MEKTELGKSGIKVGPLAFGGNVFGWTLNELNSALLLDSFIAKGFNLVDTADVYSRWVPCNQGGESESIIGKWLKKTGHRNKLVLATKVGKEMGSGKMGLGRKYIFQAVEDSLKRLQTDYIDLYQSHDDDPGTPLEETLEAYAELIKQGKVRAIGASNYTANRLAEAVSISEQRGFPRYETVQPLYNLYNRVDFEKNLQPFCIAKKIGVISYYSLASGFLTGKYRSEQDLSKSARGKGIKKYLNEKGFRILHALDEIADQYHSTPASIAIAWIKANPSITAPIASATSISQLEELVKAMELNLDQDAMDLLNKSSA